MITYFFKNDVCAILKFQYINNFFINLLRKRVLLSGVGRIFLLAMNF